jgi:hypothetical protein
MASMSATLNGQPLVCDPDSKTELMGEFGEVSLYCGFSTSVGKDGHVLEVSVQWSHAQYAALQLDAL